MQRVRQAKTTLNNISGVRFVYTGKRGGLDSEGHATPRYLDGNAFIDHLEHVDFVHIQSDTSNDIQAYGV